MVISIFKFMAEYYGVTLDAGMELTHTIAKKNFKFLGRRLFQIFLRGYPIKKIAQNKNKRRDLIYV